MIYLDNAATTRPDPLVVQHILPYLQESYGNPGAVYDFSRDAQDELAFSRRRVARFLQCDPDEIIFTSGGSESNSLVFRGLEDYMKTIGRPTVLLSETEHDSVRRAAIYLRNRGSSVLMIPVDMNGVVQLDKLQQMLQCNPVGLVSVMYVNNETGTVNPVEQIAKMCHENGALFHTDCVQAAACLQVDVGQIGCDFASISSHKIHGPKGVGALYVKDKTHLSPLVFGGDEQEFGLRGGTENVPGIAGLGLACQLYWVNTLATPPQHINDLSCVFMESLVYQLAKHGKQDLLHINGEPLRFGRKIINIRFDGIDSETLVLMMATQGIYISAGAACRSHESTPSKTLTAMGLTEQQARESVRISFSKMNTEEEVHDAGLKLAQCVVMMDGAGDISLQR